MLLKIKEVADICSVSAWITDKPIDKGRLKVVGVRAFFFYPEKLKDAWGET